MKMCAKGTLRAGSPIGPGSRAHLGLWKLSRVILEIISFNFKAMIIKKNQKNQKKIITKMKFKKKKQKKQKFKIAV